MPPTQVRIRTPGQGKRSAGLSAAASSASSRSVSFSVRRSSGRRSCSPLIAVTCRTRARVRSESPLSEQTCRATRCPPAEWPTRPTGPATVAAAASTAAATDRVIDAIRTSGASG